MNIERTFLKTLQLHHLISDGSHIVVAVSGGADSLALLHLLNAHRSSLNCSLHVATLDHGLRGEAGAQDAQFVVDTVQALGLEVTAGKADVPALAKKRGLGIEAAARIARYDFLAEVAHKVGANRVAVAHHADDQAETVLMHLLRGAGLDGLSGMGYCAPLPGHPDLLVIRPLLNMSRAEIEAYCREHNLQPRQDATNADTTYTRNRLRHEILPSLETLYPQVKRSLVQLADIASVENDYVEKELQERLIAQAQVSTKRILIPRDLFERVHPALQRRFVRWAAEQLGRWENLGYGHIVSALEIALNGKQGAIALLPDGLNLRVDYKHFVIERDDAPQTADTALLPRDTEIVVNIPGVTPLDGGWVLHAAFEAPAQPPAARLNIPPQSHVVLRTRREGDRFAPLGMKGHTQKVSKWMVEHKLPRLLRDSIPLLVVDGEIAAILWGSEWTISEKSALNHNENYEIILWLESPN